MARFPPALVIENKKLGEYFPLSPLPVSLPTRGYRGIIYIPSVHYPYKQPVFLPLANWIL
jgi:hypothetical protein